MTPDRLLNRLSSHLAARPRHRLTRPDWTPSAVLVPLHVDLGRLRLLLTERAGDLSHHAGQIAFPGGVLEAADSDPEACALRETEEELGIAPSRVSLLGCLDDTFTVRGFRISPYVGVLDTTAVHPNPAEIARVLTPPLDAFVSGDNVRFEERTFDGRVVRVSFYDLEEGTVWGATARIIEMLVRALRESGWPEARDAR